MTIYSKARPYEGYFNDVANKYGLNRHLLIHQVVAEDRDVKNPKIAEDIAPKMKANIDQIYFLRQQGASWRDIYGLAASAYKVGAETVLEAVKTAKSISFADVSTQLPREVVTYVAAPKYSVFWDFKDWGWFDTNYKPPAITPQATAESALPVTRTEPIPSWIWLSALGIFFLITRKAK